MAYRTLELTLISAQDLKDVNIFSKMEVYAVASIDGDSRSRQRTPADRHGGRSPTWNSTLRFSVPAGDPGRHVLDVLLRCERALGDRDIGEIHIPLKELLDGTKGAAASFLSYQVRTASSGKAKGVLNLSYKFIDAAKPAAGSAAAYGAAVYPPPAMGSKYDDPVTVYPASAAYPPPAKAAKAEPVTAYPAGSSGGTAYPPPGSAAPYANPYPPPQGYPGAPQATGHGYPPAQGYLGAQQATGHGYPPPQGYPGAPQATGHGYPPPQAGYGYPPPPQAGYGYPSSGYGYGAAQPAMAAQPPKKNKFGMGLGAGLLGGALGGLLIGDLVSDGGYDGGYDGGFDDGGGFDF